MPLDDLLGLATRWARSLTIEPESARLVDEGWDFDVLVATATWTGRPPSSPLAHVVTGRHDWVFRFPRRPEVAERLEIELRLLGVLAPQLPVALPHVAVTGMLPGDEHRFAGYPLLPGRALTPELVTGPRGGLLVSQLAGALATLHSMSTREAVAAGVPAHTPESWRAWLGGLVERGRREVLPLVASAAPVAAVLDGWQRRVDDAAGWPADLSVVHGDLGPPHVLADHERGVLTGIIDWTDARVGDPAMDFADLVAGLGEQSLELVLASYASAVETPPDAGFADRIRFYRELGPLHTALHGLDTGQPRYVELGVAALAAFAKG